MLIDNVTDPPVATQFKDSHGQEVDLFSVDTGPHPHKAIFFVSGSGCASLTYFMRWYFKGLGDGYRIYAVQKPGVARNSPGFSCSQEFLDWSAYPNIVELNRDGLKQVLARQGGSLDAVIGVSEGGTVAAQLAADTPKIRHLVVIGSGGLPFRKEANYLAPRLGETPEGLATAFAKIASNPNDTHETVYGMTYRYWSTTLDIDPTPIFLSAKQPTLVIMGEKDENVPIESAYHLRQRMAEAKRTNFTLRVVQGANHVLVRDGEDHKPGILHDIGTWLER